MCCWILRVAAFFFFFFQAEDGIRDLTVTGVQTCALPPSVMYRPQPRGAGLATPSRTLLQGVVRQLPVRWSIGWARVSCHKPCIGHLRSQTDRDTSRSSPNFPIPENLSV